MIWSTRQGDYIRAKRRKKRRPQQSQFKPSTGGKDKDSRTAVQGQTTTYKPPPKRAEGHKDLEGGRFHVIAAADKGNATVVMDRSDYDRKIRTLLADADTY